MLENITKRVFCFLLYPFFPHFITVRKHYSVLGSLCLVLCFWCSSPPYFFPPWQAEADHRFWMFLFVAGIPFLVHSLFWPCYAAGWWGYPDTQKWLLWLWQYPGGFSWLVKANCLFSRTYSIFLLCQYHLIEEQMLLVSIFYSSRNSKKSSFTPGV